MKHEEKTLVILVPGFPAGEEDCTCLPAQQRFIKSLSRNYPSLRLLILAFQYPFEKKDYRWHKHRVIAFGGRNRGGLHRRLLWRRVEKKLSSLAMEYHIIGLLCFWAGECALVGKRWAMKNDVKYICWLRGQDARKNNGYLRRLKPARDELVAISDFTRNELAIHHGIIAEHIIPGGSPEINGNTLHDKRDIDILCAGSLIPLKQYHLAIDLAKELRKEFPGLKMVICGKGPEEEPLQRKIKHDGLGDTVILTGEKKHAELAGLMKRSRLFLHPSLYEGFSGACLEALAAGATVVSLHQPMNEPIPKWFVAKSADEMIRKTAELLYAPPDHSPVIPYPVDESARKIMALFGL